MSSPHFLVHSLFISNLQKLKGAAISQAAHVWSGHCLHKARCFNTHVAWTLPVFSFECDQVFAALFVVFRNIGQKSKSFCVTQHTRCGHRCFGLSKLVSH